jgi:hypothetical protein
MVAASAAVLLPIDASAAGTKRLAVIPAKRPRP